MRAVPPRLLAPLSLHGTGALGLMSALQPEPSMPTWRLGKGPLHWRSTSAQRTHMPHRLPVTCSDQPVFSWSSAPLQSHVRPTGTHRPASYGWQEQLCTTDFHS